MWKRKLVLTILGRPNVGKSTLFNRLVGRRAAIVENTPGVTRDRKGLPFEYRGQAFFLMDTGGFDPEASQGMVQKIKSQTEKAIGESDGIILLFDGREGITPLDELIVSILRKVHQPVVYAINKIDSPRQQILTGDFFRLGVKPLLSISAEQSMGLDELMEEIISLCKGLLKDANETESEAEPSARIAVVGRPNVGKSTLLNFLLGDDRLITDSLPGTTRDSIDSRIGFGGKDYLFVDTAGIRRRGRIDQGIERFSISRSLQAIDQCEIAMVLLDFGEGLVEQDTKILGLVLSSQKACIILVNKCDLADTRPEAEGKIRADIERRLRFIPFAPVIFVSAIRGFDRKKIFGLVDQVMTSYRDRVPTGELNRFFEKTIHQNSPPMVQGRSVRLLYTTQIRTAPPVFVVFSNRPRGVKSSYRRYLENSLRERFGFLGVPLQLQFRQKTGTARKKR